MVSLDRDMEADIRTDIMDWDYRTYPPGSFDVIWSSPPCTEYSRAKTIGVRKLDEANGIVKRTLEIIDYFNPTYWIMENPQTGLLKSQPFIAELPYNDLDYCKYGMPYRKRTRLWNNIEAWTPRPLRPSGRTWMTSRPSPRSSPPLPKRSWHPCRPTRQALALPCRPLVPPAAIATRPTV